MTTKLSPGMIVTTTRRQHSPRVYPQTNMAEILPRPQRKSGHTSVTDNSIPTSDTKPIRLPPYRIRHAYRDIVYNELRRWKKKVSSSVPPVHGLPQLSQ